MKSQPVQSSSFKNWVAVMDPKTCIECKTLNGKIYTWYETPYPEPPLHQRGRCEIVPMKALYAGTATEKGYDGADWWLDRYACLPNYYITKNQAFNLGWRREKGNLHKVAPGKMITGGIYKNGNGHLPHKEGRVWREADINYTKGKRNKERIVFSNDGLIFVTFDHYETYYEII